MNPPHPPHTEDLRAQLVRLIVESGDGNLSTGDIASAGGSLQALGYSSLSYIRLIDGIENELGVYIDPDADTEAFSTLDNLVGLVLGGRDGSGE